MKGNSQSRKKNKLKIGILHHDLELAELKFKEIFENKGCFVDFINVKDVSEDQLLNYDIIFNRVYSSVASRDFKILNKTLFLLKFLEEKSVKCINSFKSSLFTTGSL